MIVLRRAAILLAATVVVGLLPLLTGRDPALSVLRARLADREPDAAALASVRAELGLDVGWFGLVQRWFAGLVQGDFGRSWVSGAPVGPSLLRALQVSLSLAGFAALVAVLVAGALVARPLAQGLAGRPTVASGRVAALIAAVPEFLFAMVLLLVFAVRLRLMPTAGWDSVGHAVLPSIALGLPAGAVLGTIANDAVRGALSEPWISTWHAAGFSRKRVLIAVGRRAASVVSGQLALIVAGLLGGAVAVEVVFAVPGIGRMAVSAALATDMPVVQGCVLAILLAGTVAGAFGVWAQRLLLGRAFTDRSMISARPPAMPWSKRLLPLLVLAIAGVAIVGLLRDPFAVDLTARLRPPSAEHPFGTDSLGRDVLARIGHGALRTALLAVAVTALALLIGLVWGFVVKGSGVVDVVNALPPTVAALLAAAVVGPGALGVVVAVAGVLWAPLAGHTRSLALEQHAALHLEAARAIGASKSWLLTRHVLPAVAPAVTRNAMVRLPGVALAVASLGFLGLGAQPPSPEWGLLLAEGMPYVERAPWVVLFPVAALASVGVIAVSVASRVR